MTKNKYDMLFVSSVFGELKIAEPMGACILAQILRSKGYRVKIVEPTVLGWDIARTVSEILNYDFPILGISMLRDKHVKAVLELVKIIRSRAPEMFMVVGGHGPSIAFRSENFRIQDRSQIVAAHFDGINAVTAMNPHVNDSLLTRGSNNSAYSGRGRGATSQSEEFVSEKGEVVQTEPESPYYDKSIEYAQILSTVNCVFLGEADISLPLLVDRFLTNQDWKNVPGIAYWEESGQLIRTPPAPKVGDLDTIPFMARDILEEYLSIYGKRLPASIVASRGCYYSCTFCSVVEYESIQHGPKHRLRSNSNIVNEMKELNDKYGTTHFNFEDDNFIVRNKQGTEKLLDLCDRLSELEFRPTFALFCRADAVKEDLFKRLRDSGLVGIYFGIESVHDRDLNFFHKGITASQILRATDVLISLGYSPSVDANSLRLMLGYITWHPLTSYESLRASSSFIKRIGGPPKLLRRKLRLYTGTEVIRQVTKLGLLDPRSKDGWSFRSKQLVGLDTRIDKFFALVNKTRDRFRTVEKAALEHGYEVSGIDFISRIRKDMDSRLFDYFEKIVIISETCEIGTQSVEIARFDSEQREAWSQWQTNNSVEDTIAHAFKQCNFSDKVLDLFRK